MESLIIKNYMLIPFPASNFPPIPTERNLLGFQIPSHHLNSKMVFGGWIQRGSTHETWLSCFFLSPPTPQHLKKPALWFMWPCKMALLEGGGGREGSKQESGICKNWSEDSLYEHTKQVLHIFTNSPVLLQLLSPIL